MSQEKLHVRFRIISREVLERMFHKHGLGKLELLQSEYKAMFDLYIQGNSECWITITMTPSEIRKLWLKNRGVLHYQNLNLNIPFWAIKKILISHNGKPSTWIKWSENLGWEKSDYSK